MKRKAAVAVVIVTVIAMLIPASEFGATEIGFEPGSPDPNLYQSSFRLGWPLPWIEIISERRESDGLDGTRLGSVNGLSLMIYAGMFLISGWIDPSLWKLRKRKEIES